MTKCPCHSGNIYENCCKPFHEGQLPENALQLMRSRYCAYAMKNADYIMKTTHPQSPHYESDFIQWTKGIKDFSTNTKFTGLDILEFVDGDTTAFVTFKAGLKQNGKDASFTEKSQFEKVKGKWLYHSGVHQ